MTPKWHVPRRTLLRGLGTGVALPFLEAMLLPRSKGKTARAAAAPKKSPQRFVGIWGLPCGQVGKMDPVLKCMVSPWTPDSEGPITKPDADGFLDPFFGKGTPMGANVKDMKFRDVSSKLTILSGLSDASADHQFLPALLSRAKLLCTDGANMCNGLAGMGIDVGGPTMDQIAAEYFVQQGYTPKKSLVLASMYGGNSTSGIGVYGQHMSWTSATVPVPAVYDPAAVFDDLFKGTVDPGESKAAAALRKLNRSSVLDFVKGDANAIKARVGKQDQDKVDQYLGSIREIEKRIATGDAPLGCAPPARPAEYIKGSGEMTTLDRRIRVMMDLIVKAFECDQMRVATLSYTANNGPTGGWPFIGLSGEHHGNSHYTSLQQGTPEHAKAYMSTYGKWALQMMAYLMGELDSRIENPDDGTTLLDSAVVLMSGDFADSDGHSWSSSNMPLGGRGGRTAEGNWAVRAGRHVRCSSPWQGCGADYNNCYPTSELRFKGERTTKDLLWGLLKSMGVPDQMITAGKPTFGYATAPLDLTFQNQP